MTYYTLLLGQFFLSVTILGQQLRNNNTGTFWHYPSNRTQTSESSNEIGTKENVELKVYYETYCPASVDFFVRQLKPTVERLGSYLDVHLIPYGHAKTYRSRDHYTFTCQHGVRECYSNMVHACAIDVLQDMKHAILFNACLMQYTSFNAGYKYFLSVLNWCGYTEKVELYKLWQCIKSSHGRNLLKKYGDETYKLHPSYVPFLVLDGSLKHQDDNLMATVCRMLKQKPAACLS